MELINIVKKNRTEWEEKLSTFNYSFFLSPQWVESVATNRCCPIYLDFFSDGLVVAKLSGVIINGGLLRGKRLYFYAGPAFQTYNNDLHRNVLATLLDYAKNEKYAKISIRPFDEVVHERANVEGYKVLKSQEYKIHFSPDVELKKFSFGFRQNIKKAKKAGVEIHMTHSDKLLDVLFNLIGNTQKVRTGKYCVEYNPLGLLNLNEITLRRLLQTGVGKFYYVTIEDKIISIQLNLEFNNRTYGFLMGSDNIAYKIGVPSFLDVNVIEFARTNGYSCYNLGGAPAEEQGGAGISKYKESMGAVLFETYGYYSPFLGFRSYLLKPIIWFLERIKSFSFVKKFQLYASKKGWIE